MSGSPIPILQLTATLSVGGSERLAATLGRHLTTRGYDTHFACLDQDGDIGTELREAGFDVRCLEKRPGLDVRLPRRVGALVREEGIRLVQTHHVGPLVYGVMAARWNRAKVVHTEHETLSFENAPRTKSLLRAFAPWAHAFVAIDPVVADFFVERGIAANRVHLIRNGIDLGRFSPRRDALPADAWPRDRPVRIGWLARLAPPKRPDVLVDAVAQLVQERAAAADSPLPLVELHLIGPGTLEQPTRDRLAEAGLADRSSVPGPRSDVPEQLRHFDIYVLASDEEGLPISLVEAMATGLPVIASAVGGIPGLIEDGENGLLLRRNEPAELADVLRRLLLSPGLARGLGQAARMTAEARFDLAATMDAYDGLFRSLLSAGR